MQSVHPDGSARIAYVGADHQLHVVHPDGSGRRQATWPGVPGPLMVWGGSRGRDARSWPCWSPDGRWLACFLATQGGDVAGPVSVRVVEVDGVDEQELVHLDDQLPIYAQWAPSGQHLAVLSQMEDELQLWTCPAFPSQDSVDGAEVPAGVGRRVIDQGVPLFFSWSPGGDRLLLHVGRQSEPQGALLVRDPDGQAEDELLPDPAGAFCTPVYVDGTAVVVATVDGDAVLCAIEPDGKNRRILAHTQGLVAVVPSPKGGVVAYGAAQAGSSTPYDCVWLVGLDGKGHRKVISTPCIAFFFLPSGEQLVYATWDPDEHQGHWWIQNLAGGSPRPLCPFWPSRDQLFYLHFFEQFCQSHRTISPDGRWLVYASHPDPETTGGANRSSRIYVVDLQEPTPQPVLLADGSFAVFSPC